MGSPVECTAARGGVGRRAEVIPSVFKMKLKFREDQQFAKIIQTPSEGQLHSLNQYLKVPVGQALGRV